MYVYRIKKNGFYKDYSIKYKFKKDAVNWYKNKYIQISDRKLILFKNSKRID